jgi:hypothetical protein
VVIKWILPKDKNEILVTGMDNTYHIEDILDKMMSDN